MSLLDESEEKDFRDSLVAAGYTAEDFNLAEEEDIPQGGGVHAVRGYAVVGRVSSAITRRYRAGHGTAWVCDFVTDLKGGVFGPP